MNIYQWVHTEGADHHGNGSDRCPKGHRPVHTPTPLETHSAQNQSGRKGGRRRILLKGLGVGDLEPKTPKFCVPKIALINISFCKFNCFPP